MKLVTNSFQMTTPCKDLGGTEVLGRHPTPPVRAFDLTASRTLLPHPRRRCPALAHSLPMPDAALDAYPLHLTCFTFLGLLCVPVRAQGKARGSASAQKGSPPGADAPTSLSAKRSLLAADRVALDRSRLYRSCLTFTAATARSVFDPWISSAVPCAGFADGHVHSLLLRPFVCCRSLQKFPLLPCVCQTSRSSSTARATLISY